ncbi:MAG: histidine phosphatase family protein [Gammaproteobacteria bacterium]
MTSATPGIPYFRGIGFALVCAILAGCGGGAGTEVLPQLNLPGTTTYTGAPPATADVQAFMTSLWGNIARPDRCGGCHSETGGQAPLFARADDVNLAYDAAISLVDLASPVDSRLVVKVAGGHNCWETVPGVCADIITGWISNWGGNTTGDTARIVELQAPVIRDVGQSRTFPADSSLFATTVHPLLTANCSNCHSSSAGAQAQTPFFADADPDAAYEAVRSKIDLDDPANSRLVNRLRFEFHNCWTNCGADATEMQTRIETFAGSIVPTAVDPNLVISKALALFDGIIASGGNRYEANQIALWEFKTGTGTTAFDTSGVDPAINLSLSGEITWVGGWGIDIKSGKAQGSTADSKKLHDMIKSSGEYSIEAWVVPGNVAQEEARIISYSAGTTARNFHLGQTLYSYDFYNRSGTTDGNGGTLLTLVEGSRAIRLSTAQLNVDVALEVSQHQGDLAFLFTRNNLLGTVLDIHNDNPRFQILAVPIGTRPIFENIHVTLPGQSPDRLVIGCHHDTKRCEGHDDPDHKGGMAEVARSAAPVAPGAETFFEFRARLTAGWEELSQRHAGHRLLLVGHGGALKALLCILLGLPDACVDRLSLRGNTGLSAVEFRGDKARLALLNCTRHLEDTR